MKKIKVMFVTRGLSFGGLERVIINLCRFVNRDIFEPVVVCLKRRGELAYELDAMGIRVHTLKQNYGKLSKYFTWLYLSRLMKSESVDIIHSHNTGPFLDCRLALLFLNNRVIFFHTDHARVFPDKFRYMLFEFLSSFRNSKIIAVSHKLKHQLIKYEKIPSNKIDVILNGIEKSLEPSKKSLEKLRQSVLQRQYGFVIGLGVVLSEQKGIIHLIHAAPEILKKYPDTGFLIAGDGPVRGFLEKEVNKLGLKNNFVFLGFRKDIPFLLYLIDLYVFPSEWEGLPLAILEAMAAKRCILSTDVGGIPLALKNNSNAILIPAKRPDLIAEKTIWLMKNSALREKLANNAQQSFLNKFDVRSMVESYEKLYLKYYRG